MLCNRSRAEHVLKRMNIPDTNPNYIDYREAIVAELNERAGDDARAAEGALRERTSDACSWCKAELSRTIRENCQLIPRRWPVHD
jgi:hypothetical protein